jgi:hypothetical protein
MLQETVIVRVQHDSEADIEEFDVPIAPQAGHESYQSVKEWQMELLRVQDRRHFNGLENSMMIFNYALGLCDTRIGGVVRGQKQYRTCDVCPSIRSSRTAPLRRNHSRFHAANSALN